MNIHCPYCQSTHVKLNSHPVAQTNTDLTLVSPMSLAALGVTTSKSLNIPPIVGGLIGAAVGGLFLVLLDKQTPLIEHKTSGICLDCHRSF